MSFSVRNLFSDQKEQWHYFLKPTKWEKIVRKCKLKMIFFATPGSHCTPLNTTVGGGLKVQSLKRSNSANIAQNRVNFKMHDFLPLIKRSKQFQIWVYMHLISVGNQIGLYRATRSYPLPKRSSSYATIAQLELIVSQDSVRVTRWALASGKGWGRSRNSKIA